MLDMTVAQINCLLAIRELYHEGPVASKEIAVQLRVSRPSVHRLLDALIRKELVCKEPYGAVHLTAKGQATADKMQALCEALTARLRAALCLSEQSAEAAALAMMSSLGEDDLTACAQKTALQAAV